MNSFPISDSSFEAPRSTPHTPSQSSHAEKPSRLSLSSLHPCSFAFGGAIFDFDGTLADSWNVWRQVDELFLAQRGLTRPQDFSSQMAGRSFMEGARWVVKRFNLSDTPQQVCDQWNALGCELYKTQVSLLPGALTYLEALKQQGVPLALATTNNPQVLASLSHLIDVHEIFDVCLFGTDVTRDKRFPDIYKTAAERLGIAPSQAVVFEDIPQGLKVAGDAGFATVGVLNDDPEQEPTRIQQAAQLTICSWRDLL